MGECLKEWAKDFSATELTEISEKNLKISALSVAKPTTLDTPGYGAVLMPYKFHPARSRINVNSAGGRG